MIRNSISVFFILFLSTQLLTGQQQSVNNLIADGWEFLKSREYNELDSIIQQIEIQLQNENPDMVESEIKFGQLKAKSLFMRFKRIEAENVLLGIFPKIESFFGEDHVEVAQIALDIGNYSLDNEKAKNFIQKALGIYRELNDSFHIAGCLLDLGIKTYRTYQLPQAQRYFKEGMHFLATNPNNQIKSRLLFYQGRYYKAIGDYESAIFQMQQALDSLHANHPNDPVIISVARDLGLMLKDLGKYEEAIAVFKKPIRGESQEISFHRFLAEAQLWSEIGITQSEMGKHSESIRTLTTLVEGMEDSLDRYHIDLNYPMAYLITAYLEDGKEDDALQTAMHADSIVEANPLQIHVDYSRFCLKMSEAFGRLRNEQMQRKYNDLAIKSLGADPDDIKTFADVSQIDVLLSILNSKSDYLFDAYQKSNHSESPEFEEHIQKHLSVLDYLNHHQLNPDVRLATLEDNYHVLENGLAYYNDKFQATKNRNDFLAALTLAENGRDHLLKEAQVRRNLGKEMGIPTDFFRKEAELQQGLANIEVKIFNNRESKNLQKFEEEKRSIVSELESLALALETDLQMTNLDPQKNKLIEKNFRNISLSVSVIELFQTAENLYVFLFEKGKNSLFKMSEPAALKAAVQLFPKELSNPLSSNGWKKTAENIGTYFAPVLNQISPRSDKLIIIPHGSWSAIPFEMIPIGKGADSQLLVDKFAVSYANSLSTYVNVKLGKKNADLHFLAGFAPSYDKMQISKEDTLGMDLFAELVRSGDFHLPSAIKEVEEITKMTGGQAYFDTEANESTFKRVASDYRILHFSMHALEEPTNPKFSRLLFSQSNDQKEDNYVFANELSAMRLNADLAVLSACNTGSGKFQKGEGTMSLSRAFQYAGVPSIVHSLWKVPDQATSQIMISFYKHLLAGTDKAKALQRAKQDYLASTIAIERRHPFYWAGFVLNGNIDPIIENPSRGYLVWIGLGILGLLLFLAWFLKRKSS